MKNLKYIPFLVLIVLLGACNGDDDAPEVVNEEELITSVILTLTNGSETIELSSRDLDGDGPNDPEVEVSGNLQPSTTYTGSVRFLNETESPAENITLEVVEEADEHQVFYTSSASLSLAVDYVDTDSDGNPLGTQVTLTTLDEPTDGTLNVTLRHEPTKPNDGTLSDAGGETDISVTFNVIVQ